MSAYRGALAMDAGSSEERLMLAAKTLNQGTGVVLFEKIIALRTVDLHLVCEVVDPEPSGRRCENEFEVLVENAQGMLALSRFQTHLPDLPRRWLVVEDRGTSTMELWHTPQ